MEFDEILRGHGQRVPIREAEIQKYAKKVAALYKEKIALLPDHVKSSMSIGAVVVDIGKHNTARDTFEQVYRSAETHQSSIFDLRSRRKPRIPVRTSETACASRIPM